MTQHESILNYLRSGKSLTVTTALAELGVYALSQRVGDLRREGHDIADEWVESGNKRFKRYFLEPRELPFVDRLSTKETTQL